MRIAIAVVLVASLLVSCSSSNDEGDLVGFVDTSPEASAAPAPTAAVTATTVQATSTAAAATATTAPAIATAVPPTIAPTTDARAGCSPAYPTVCIPPAPPDLNCKDIPYKRFQVLPPDPHDFDSNHDGVGCES
ncbi:hypothetical protein AYO38_09720 [bacterium SCGC AG-212-C10]|nr:hypothetical protein AYO38_09720 [bacterium SCGC AG-212-C10]